MKTRTKIIAGIAAAFFLFIAVAVFIGFYKSLMRYEMGVLEVPELYIMYGVNMSSSSEKKVVLPQAKDDIRGAFRFLFPEQETGVKFVPADITGFVVSRSFFDSYNPQEENGEFQKASLSNFKAAVLQTGIFGAARAAAKQSKGNKNNAYDAFEAFKKENEIKPNATLRVVYSNLTSVDYVPVSISYDELGDLFGLVKERIEAGGK
jgi:hypothetical protein